MTDLPSKHGWREALDHQTTLTKFFTTDIAASFAKGFAADAYDKGRPHEAHFYEVMCPVQLAVLEQAEPIFVDDDMVTLVQEAAKTFEPEPFHPEDLLVPSGFAYFAKPLSTFDVHGNTIQFRALSWAPAKYDEEATVPTTRERAGRERVSGIVVSYYSHMNDPDAYGFHKLVEENPGAELWHYPLTPSHMTMIEFGEEFYWTPDEAGFPDDVYDPIAIDSFRQMWRLTQVMLRLMVQRITTVETFPAPRAARKRAARAGMREREVTVVTLRRLRERAHEHAERTGAEHKKPVHDHRWLVRGHWRNQWYPAAKTHRRIWISEYVKGPDEAELRVKPRAYELVR